MNQLSDVELLLIGGAIGFVSSLLTTALLSFVNYYLNQKGEREKLRREVQKEWGRASVLSTEVMKFEGPDTSEYSVKAQEPFRVVEGEELASMLGSFQAISSIFEGKIKDYNEKTQSPEKPDV